MYDSLYTYVLGEAGLEPTFPGNEPVNLTLIYSPNV